MQDIMVGRIRIGKIVPKMGYHGKYFEIYVDGRRRRASDSTELRQIVDEEKKRYRDATR